VELVQVYLVRPEGGRGWPGPRCGRSPGRRGFPVAVGVPQEPGLGRDDEVVAVGVQRLADEPLGDARAVGVRGVDDVHAQFVRPAEDVARVLLVVGRADDVLAGESHRAEAKPVDGQLAADVERVALVLGSHR